MYNIGMKSNYLNDIDFSKKDVEDFEKCRCNLYTKDEILKKIKILESKGIEVTEEMKSNMLKQVE